MPAKKALKMTRGERSAMVIDRWATMESELDRLRKQVFSTESDRMYVEKQLAEANELLQSGQETMREHAKVVVELTEALTAARAELATKKRQLSDFEANIRELAAESEWWQGEAANLRSELLALIRDEARRAKPAVDPPSDDLQDIEALQALALRGGVA